MGHNSLDDVAVEVADKCEGEEKVESHQKHEVALPREVISQKVEGTGIQ